jgi:D-alanyl-D-alanine carboxypeptidase
MAVDDPFPTFERKTVDPTSLEPLYGVYAAEGGDRRFFAKEGKLFTQRSGGPALEALPAGDNKFFYADSLTWFELKEDKGTPQMAMYQQGAAKAELSLRTGPMPPEAKLVELPKSVLDRYVGSYRAAMGVAKVAIADGGPLTLQLGGQRPVPIKPVSQTEFLADGVDAKVVFHLDGTAVKRLVIHQGGRELPAERLPN